MQHSGRWRFFTLLGNLWVQRFLLVGFLTLVFWDNLWGGVPRADQVPYLHQVSQFHDLWDILVNSPSWNRTQASGGDSSLFRPLLYLQLGTFYFFFGYNFVLWQIGSLFLHTLVVCGVHLLLLAGRLRHTVYPFLLSALFGTSLLGSELVMWNHIGGYILFSVFGVYSVYCLIRYLDSKNTSLAWMSVVLAVLSEFTYELGVVLTLLMSLFFFLRNYSISKSAQPSSEGASNISWGWVCLFGALLYPILSIFDFWVRSGIHPLVSHEANSSTQQWTSTVLLVFWYAFKQIGFWIGGWLFPAAFDIRAAGRASFVGFTIASKWFLLNCSFVLLILFSFFSKIGNWRFSLRFGNRNTWLAALLPIIFLVSYSLVIAYGRALPRGLDYVFSINIYYSYIACLAVVVGIAIFAINRAAIPFGEGLVGITAISSDRGWLSLFSCNLFIGLGVSALILFNSYNVALLGKSYRYDFSPSMQEVINDVEAWLATQGAVPSAYFTVSANCLGNDALSWFDQGHFRKGSGWAPPVGLVDALWPDKSFNINKEKLHNRTDFLVTEIKCPEIHSSSTLGEYGPRGLLNAVNPGWHASSPVVYPQNLTLDFNQPRVIQKISFLPQNGLPNRAPKSIRIEASIDGMQWNNIASEDLNCSNEPDQWNSVKTTTHVKVRYLRINILSNCGDSSLLTLRGLRVE